MSQAIVELPQLLAQMQPQRQPGCWAWCQLPTNALPPAGALASFRELEGLSVVVAEAEALAQGWTIAFRAAWIRLQVHSALAAVGLTAAVSTALSQAGISCNVIAAVHHDHLFVPLEQADQAIAVLQRLSAAARS